MKYFQTIRYWPATTLVALLVTLSAPAFAETTSEEEPEESRALWLLSAEAGVGPIEEDLFLHLTPRLTFIHPTPLPFCEETANQDCETLFEASLQIPLRLRIVDREPEQGDILRREDWLEVSDYFRVIRRIEYGTSRERFHFRAGEIGPANLGNGTIVNGYYNVITTDHYRLGLQGRIDRDRWGAELLVNNLAFPNLLGVRGHMRPELIYDESSSWRRFSLGATGVADLDAPTALSREGDEFAIAGPNRQPVVETSQPTLIVGADVRWHLFHERDWGLTPFADFNHHLGLGSGLHTGVFWSQNFGGFVQLSSRLEYRYLMDRYLPDFIDPLYEITRYQYPAIDEPGLAGPKLRVARSADARARHGGFGQLQARVVDKVVLSAAYADAQGPSNADLRVRASLEFNDRARMGLFYYKFAQGEADGFGSLLSNLVDPEGSLTAAEGRVGVWGPVYAHGQLARQWQLRDDGRFESIHLWNVGLGAGKQF